MNEYVVVLNHILGSNFGKLCGDARALVLLLERRFYLKGSLLKKALTTTLTRTKQEGAASPLGVSWDE